MTLFFPDLNVWLALSVARHIHRERAWNWLQLLPDSGRLIYTRFTQLGLLRLLTSEAAMGEQTLVLKEAWSVYDEWLLDARVEFHPEPRSLDELFRRATQTFAGQRASKSVGDCYLLACAKGSGATLVTFDRALLKLAHRQGCRAITPG